MARKRYPPSKPKLRSAPPRTVTDGPFAETKELIVGAWVKPDESDLELVTTGEFRTPGELPE